jgi:hypothetical protein
MQPETDSIFRVPDKVGLGEILSWNPFRHKRRGRKFKFRGWPKAACKRANHKEEQKGAQPQMPKLARSKQENESCNKEGDFQDGNGEIYRSRNILGFHKNLPNYLS